jgi:ABC-type cobalamin/Fe3+-siderophores transport system ATPase subunit
MAPSSKTTPVAPAPTGTVDGQLAVTELLAPLEWGEAPQIGVLGDTGAGKTTLMLAIVEEYLRRSPGWVLVIDDKERRARYQGQERRDVADLVANPVDPNGRRVIVFRGDIVNGVDASPEEVAELAWRRAARGRASLIVHDELLAGREETVAKGRQWRKGVTFVPRSFTKGRVVGIGDLWGAQSPQDVPLEPFEQSSAIVCFKLGGMGLEKLRERNYLEGGAGEAIPRLHAMESPPASRGDFVVLRRGLPWNRKVSKLKEVPT